MTGMDKFPDDEKRWFMHLGYLAHNWAALDHSLDGIVRQLHATFDGSKIESEPPQSFNRKRTYIRKAFAVHPNLAQFAEGMSEFLEEATRLSEIRHWALHSGRADSGETATLNRWRKAKMEHEQREVSIQEIFDAALQCASLTLTLNLVIHFYFGFKTREEVEKLVGEITGKLGTPLPSDDPAG
jgi:hypothetical protein